MNIDEKIIKFVYESQKDIDKQINTEDIILEFNNYSKGYVYDRAQVLKNNKYIISIKYKSRFLKLSSKGEEWAIKLKDKEGE